MRKCELCESEAAIHCVSDQASLCWTCDFKVHGANFLVARHSRNVLCRVCQCPTPWSASGAKLSSAVSFCAACVLARDRIEIDLYASQGETDSSEDEDEVVPPPPEPSSSSGDDEEFYSDLG